MTWVNVHSCVCLCVYVKREREREREREGDYSFAFLNWIIQISSPFIFLPLHLDPDAVVSVHLSSVDFECAIQNFVPEILEPLQAFPLAVFAVHDIFFISVGGGACHLLFSFKRFYDIAFSLVAWIGRIGTCHGGGFF